MQQFTHEELQTIIDAKLQGKDYIEYEVMTPNGSWIALFCGRCGRIVHHPDCPEWNTNAEEAPPA